MVVGSSPTRRTKSPDRRPPDRPRLGGRPAEDRHDGSTLIGRFDDLDVLTITGRPQMGRVRCTARDGSLETDISFQSVDEILSRGRDGGLLTHLRERFAVSSGVSGVQPNVLIRDETDVSVPGKFGERDFNGATHIVKFWHPDEFPQLAVNEFFCMRAAAKAGTTVPRVCLAKNGATLVIDRFDLGPDGTCRGLEDFCVLNSKRTAEK